MVVASRPGLDLTLGQQCAEGELLTGSQMVWEALLREGVDVVFGYPGGQVIPLYHALPDYPLHHVLVRHEQAAAHAADGYARATGKVGVCVATSGPGATNLITGIATAYLDSSPIVAITGQVPTNLLGRNAFQEVDTCSISKAITKANFLVTEAAAVGPTLHEAFRLAASGRPGPVLVDIPRDVQVAQDRLSPLATPEPQPEANVDADPRLVRQVAALIRGAQRPLILAGHGVELSGASAELRRLAEATGIPVISTMMGLGSFPGSHPLYFGMVGMHGRAYANLALADCDLLLVLGSRLGDRTTSKTAAFASRATVVHVDVDPAEIGKNVAADVSFVGDVRVFLEALLREGVKRDGSEWLAQLSRRRAETPAREWGGNGHVSPQRAIRQLQQETKGEAVIVTDVGQHQLWAAQHYVYDRPRSFLSSGGLGTMGFGLPAALGAKMGRPEADVWLVSGDGGLQMTVQELATVVQEGVDLKMALFNNGYLGMVRQWQELFYSRRYSSTTITGPDFLKVADAYDVPARRVEQDEDVAEALRWARAVDGPALVEFIIEPEENVYPMVAPGGALTEIIDA